MSKTKNQYTFYYPKWDTQASFVIMEPSIVHQISRVLRLYIGDSLLLLDGNGSSLQVNILAIDKKSIICEPIKKNYQLPNPVKIHLIIGTPKKEALKDILKYGVQIGMSSISLVDMEFSQIKSSQYQLKNIYWENILKESLEQSQRLYLPKIKYYSSLVDFLKTPIVNIYTADLSDDETENISSLDKVLQVDKDNYYFIIGPEGGLSDKDRDLLKSYKLYCPFSLSSAILRVETAAISTLVSAKLLLFSQILKK